MAHQIRVTVEGPSHKAIKIESSTDDGNTWKPGQDKKPDHGPKEGEAQIPFHITTYKENSPAWCQVRCRGITKWVPC